MVYSYVCVGFRVLGGVLRECVWGASGVFILDFGVHGHEVVLCKVSGVSRFLVW